MIKLKWGWAIVIVPITADRYSTRLELAVLVSPKTLEEEIDVNGSS